jgi:hypothetical protein
MKRQVVAVQISAFRRDAQVTCFLGSRELGGAKVGKRGEVTEFSDRSRSRLLFTAFNASVDWLAFATLTYPMEFPNDGRKVKRHINILCRWMVRRFGASYLWGIEFQERGAPHFHLLVDKFIPKDELSKRWFEIVSSGDEKHLRAGTTIEYLRSTEQGGAYMAEKYCAKKDFQKVVPPGYESVGRFWGSTRGIVVPLFSDVMITKDALPKVRVLRKFTESKLKPRPLQPCRDEVKRKRKVKRCSSYFLHGGLQGFKSFKSSDVAMRLLVED